MAKSKKVRGVSEEVVIKASGSLQGCHAEILDEFESGMLKVKILDGELKGEITSVHPDHCTIPVVEEYSPHPKEVEEKHQGEET